MNKESEEMVTGDLKINREKLREWLKLYKLNEPELAEQLGIGGGNFSNMLNGVIPTSKSVIEKILTRTKLPVSEILVFEDYAQKQT